MYLLWRKQRPQKTPSSSQWGMKRHRSTATSIKVAKRLSVFQRVLPVESPRERPRGTPIFAFSTPHWLVSGLGLISPWPPPIEGRGDEFLLLGLAIRDSPDLEIMVLRNY